jgi:hypothetical protein
MLPAFFDSLVALITRTSTGLPPGRNAMRAVFEGEERSRRPGPTRHVGDVGETILKRYGVRVVIGKGGMLEKLI